MRRLREVDAERRLVLQYLAWTGFAGAAMATGMVRPARAANAPGWPADAFAQKDEAGALHALYGKDAAQSDQITLDVPEIAENGAVVPVSVSSKLPGITSIAILVPGNPFTLAAAYDIPEGTQPSVSCRLKMAKTANVVAVVRTADKVHSTSKEVKVTLGGCGG